MEVKRQDKGKVTIISFDGEDQFYDSDPLWAAMQNVLLEGRYEILVDFAAITYISSSVLGCLITMFREVKEKSGHLKIVNVQPGVSNVFVITRLDRNIEMFNDEETALKSFG